MPNTLNPHSPTEPTAPTGINGAYWNCEVHAAAGGYEGTVTVRDNVGKVKYVVTLQGDSVSRLLLELSAIGRGGGQV